MKIVHRLIELILCTGVIWFFMSRLSPHRQDLLLAFLGKAWPYIIVAGLVCWGTLYLAKRMAK